MEHQPGLQPLEELAHLETEANSAARFSDLREVLRRADEIERENADDFEVRMAVADLKQKLFERGRQLKKAERAAKPAPRPNPTVPKRPPSPPAASSAEKSAWRKAVMMGLLAGLFASIILWVAMVQLARKRNPDLAPVPSNGGLITVTISTTPPGAAISINNEPKCTSNCKVDLSPGNYQVTALLDGFDPVATGVTVVPGAPVNVNMPLQAQNQAVRILTDLPNGRVTLDGQPAGELQDGQLVLEKVKNGEHKVRVFGEKGEAQFAFDLKPGEPARAQGAITARDVLAVVVGTLGNQAMVQTSSPQKVALDGTPRGESGPDGLQLKDVLPGNHDLALGEGPEQKKVVVTFGPAPTLTAFLKADVNSGTLVVFTGEDGATVWVNGKEQKRKTRQGQLRLLALGDVNVRVEKEGFQPVAERSAKVAKGEEKRLEFRLIPLPQVASLQVRGGAPGTTVHIGNRELGTVATDGMLSAANIPPGAHTLELRRQGFANKQFAREFRPGETVVITGADLAMTPTTGILHLSLNPSDAQVSYRHSDEAQGHAAREGPLKLEAGSYVFTAKAQGYIDRTERVQVAAGESRPLDLTLTKLPATVTAKTSPVSGPDWSKSGWALDEGTWVRRGGNFVVVRPGPVNGSIGFTAELKKGGNIFRSGKIRWFVDYTDAKNYALFELDKKGLVVKDVREGRSFDKDKSQHNAGDLRSVDIQVEVTRDKVVTRMKTAQGWVVLNTWSEPGRDFSDGKFGFLVPGSDEIGIANFRFAPR